MKSKVVFLLLTLFFSVPTQHLWADPAPSTPENCQEKLNELLQNNDDFKKAFFDYAELKAKLTFFKMQRAFLILKEGLGSVGQTEIETKIIEKINEIKDFEDVEALEGAQRTAKLGQIRAQVVSLYRYMMDPSVAGPTLQNPDLLIGLQSFEGVLERTPQSAPFLFTQSDRFIIETLAKMRGGDSQELLAHMVAQLKVANTDTPSEQILQGLKDRPQLESQIQSLDGQIEGLKEALLQKLNELMGQNCPCLRSTLEGSQCMNPGENVQNADCALLSLTSTLGAEKLAQLATDSWPFIKLMLPPATASTPTPTPTPTPAASTDPYELKIEKEYDYTKKMKLKVTLKKNGTELSALEAGHEIVWEADKEFHAEAQKGSDDKYTLRKNALKLSGVKKQENESYELKASLVMGSEVKATDTYAVPKQGERASDEDSDNEEEEVVGLPIDEEALIDEPEDLGGVYKRSPPPYQPMMAPPHCFVSGGCRLIEGVL